MKSITVQIGNSDDRLTQKEWSDYILRVDSEICARATQIHFFGTSLTTEVWQNACWVFSIDHPDRDKEIDIMKRMLRATATMFRQDSIAWVDGDTEFI